MKTETETETEMGRAGRRPGPLRWRALFLAVVLLPAAAWGEQTASEKLKEQLDRRLWKEVGGCPGAERYLKALPEGLHAGDARGCLAAGQVERQVERLLEECEAHFAAGRLSTGRGGSAVDCYGEVLLLDRGNRDALSGLDRVMGEYGRRVRKALEGGRLERARGYLEEMEKLSPESRDVEELEEAVAKAEERLETMRQYAETGREAVGRGDLAKARRYVERLRELDAKSPLAVELAEAVAEAEQAAEAERQAEERERKAREAEERRRAEAERKRKAEAEEAARRARAEAERKRKEREAEERRQAEAERKRKEREAEEQRRAAVEESYWRKCEQNDEARYCEEYLSRYGDGVHARQARRRLAELAVPRPGTTFRDCPGCPEMVVVPAGRFEMGSTSGDSDERPVHPVTIARPFAVGVHEVTFGEWDACVSGGGCGGYRPNDGSWGRGRRPVIHVSWDDANAYVRWLSEETGEDYRLLSEAEWEYVARAGTTTEYWWGDDVGRNRANCEVCGSRWDDKQTAPVGSFSANPFGLYDVHGNVWEWVEDCWNDSYAGAPRDGSAWTSGECGGRVLRGGSRVDGPGILRSANRFSYSTGNRHVDDGFRVARTLTP